MHRGPVTRKDLLQSGMSRWTLESRLRSGHWVELRRSVYIARDDLMADMDPAARYKIDVAAAALGLGARTVISHESAAVIHDLPLIQPLPGFDPLGLGPYLVGGGGDAPPEIVEYGEWPDCLVTVTRPRLANRGKPPYGIRVHHSDAAIEEYNLIDGVPVTTLEHTAVDLARTLSFRDAVAVVDAALCRRREDRVTKSDLRRIIAHEPWVQGNPQALKVIDFATDLSDSPLESCARVAFHTLGLPVPVLQYKIAVEPDVFADFCWPAPLWTVAETDGRLKYQSKSDLWREKLREDRIRELGYEVVRITWEQVFREQSGLNRRLRAAFERGKARHA